MKYLSRVVWSEGMYLGPHHFQAQNRYFEDSIRFATSALWYCPWGISGCNLDAEALQNGTVSVVYARGLFPDGLAFHMPECDPLPAPRNITELVPPTRDSVTILLTVPARKPEGLNCQMDGDEADASVRFRAESRLLHDETNGRDEKPVNLGRKNIELMLDTEIPEDSERDLLRIPIARVMRQGAGFVFDPEFIAPCVEIRASEHLMSLLRRLIEILDEKGSTFARRGSEKRSWAEFSTREIANFWFLHTVNSALAPLRHQFLTKRGHPEELYMEMLRLAGGLCTFAFDSHPRDLPLYDHEHLDKCFGDLDAHIRRHLETIVPSQYITIPLVKRADYFYEGEIKDQRVLDRSRWIFAIRSQIGEVEVISKTPQLVKLCSKQFVPQLVKRALPGLAMTHLPVPPPQIPARIDFQYFGVGKGGPCWDHLVQSRQIGLYVPGDLPNPEIELMVILER